MNLTATDPSPEKTDILLLSGFLGAGKTTLLKRILSWQSSLADTVVIVNEFGSVGIDGALLQSAGSDVVELASGCVCCTLRNDLMATLLDVHRRFAPRRIILEASGVADPTAVISLCSEPVLREQMQIGKTITVFDADYWDARDAFGTILMSQLQAADLILLNKVDLLDKAEVALILRQMHAALPGAQIVPTIQCAIDPETLWERPTGKPGRLDAQVFFPMAPSSAAHTGDGHNHRADNAGYVAFCFENNREVDENRFHHFLDTLPEEIFRIKGPVRLADRTELFNYVGGRGDWFAWEGDTATRLVFIGWDIDENETLAAMQACLAD